MCGIWGMLSLKTIQYDITKLFNSFNKIKYRGPDKSVFIQDSNYIVGFHRLAIMDQSIKGMQPFTFRYQFINKDDEQIERIIYLIANGEIYNVDELKQSDEFKKFIENSGYKFTSDSDCEILLPLFLMDINDADFNNEEKNKANGIRSMLNKLNGEFAFGIWDIRRNVSTDEINYSLWLGRDRFGIRPLFYSKLNDYTISFGSEMKSLIDIDSNNKIEVFDPRSWSYWKGINGGTMLEHGKQLYYVVGNLPMILKPDLDDVYRMIRTKLTSSVIARLESDREIGCLLSGGLDSSLISAIAAKELALTGKKLRTFCVGMNNSPDLINAQIVADYIGSMHTNIIIPQNEWLDAINHVIYITETFDITTIRASVGQYLVSKWIKTNTNIKVLLVGDGSDEVTGGYLYFHRAPNPHELHFECKKLLHYIHYFDVLRTDRGIASNGLEARVPFLDHNFVNLYMQIDPILRMPKIKSNTDSTIYEKYLLRKAFDKTNLLPESILWRRKEAFSDGVSANQESTSWYQIIQDKINASMSDEYFNNNILKYKEFVTPHTKEALFYHEIYDKYFPLQLDVCPYYWLPNWSDGATDPSARTLQIYNK